MSTNHALVAALIRKELKQLYPGIKFSIRSWKAAGGETVHVNWGDDPVYDEVYALTRKYVIRAGKETPCVQYVSCFGK